MRPTFALASSTAVAWWLLSGTATAQLLVPEEIQPGTRIEMEGRISDPGTLVAHELIVLRAPTGEDSIKGIVQEIDHAAKTLVVAGAKVDCSGDCFVAAASGRPVSYEKIEIGNRAKVKGMFEKGAIVADYIKVEVVQGGESSECDLEGRVTRVDRERNQFVVNGVEVQLTPRTLVELE